MEKKRVSLQISLTSLDFEHAKHILPLQIETLIGQVDEVLLVIDDKPTVMQKSKRNFLTCPLRRLISTLQESYQAVRVIEVDSSANIMKKTSRFFFRRDRIPLNDWRGGAFYGYFYGLFSAKNDYIFHLDSDILLGGNSRSWLEEALNLLDKHRDNCFVVSPLPGPPHPDRILIGQDQYQKVDGQEYMFRFQRMSTRIFLLDRSVFSKQKLQLMRPSWPHVWSALKNRNPIVELPEHIISEFMMENNFDRIDFLGTEKGLWSLHPPYRTSTFHHQLEEIVRKVKHGVLPKEQLGYYDLIDMFWKLK